MDTEASLNLQIMKITIRILEHYPELYRNLNEMFATLPIKESPVINIGTLNKWLESLRMLVQQYDAAHIR